MNRFVAIGECMTELSAAGTPDLMRVGVAGDTLNTAWYARAALAADWTVDYVTRLGTDPFSDRIFTFLADNGLGTGHIGRDSDRGAGLYAISLEDGERSFTYWRDRSAARLLADDAGFLASALERAGLIYISGITLAILSPEARARLLEALAAARRAGARVAFDSNYRPRLWETVETARAGMLSALSLCDIALPSAEDEAALFGDDDPQEIVARYKAAGVREGVVKTGGAEVHWWAEGGIGGTIALDRATPVDTTGAGDSFNGGYLAARLSGADPDQAIGFGHRVASTVIARHGALVPMPEIAALPAPASRQAPHQAGRAGFRSDADTAAKDD